ncbi:DegT/DnrJ/EryC1/StrS family aminotransferase [Oligoflexia bacterium]|nr:DegT/DnrJ/EryC1/StrS family aminotransferase [Oligoflexia bacterium]
MLMKEIYVTQPVLPPLEEFIEYLEKIWDSKHLTNSGPFHEQFEPALAEYLGVKHLALFVNGTIALVTALQALRVTGEVITTPYSFVATSHSLIWNNLNPVFVDVDPLSFNLDPNRIEEAITPKTTAILAVHCYGNPCDMESIQRIADTYGLSVIYDAAAAFGVKYKGETLLNNGDLSVLSFHATKVFNTFEGGAIVCPNAKTKQRIDYLKNFGHSGEVTVVAPGINGKMNELQAALGMLQLKYIDEAINQRRLIDLQYRQLLSNISGITCPGVTPDATKNYSYFPILVNGEYPISRDALYHKLRENNIYARRYFYPLIADFPMYRGLPSANRDNLPVANDLTQKILCLPIYPNLQKEQVDEIANVIAMAHKEGK